MIFNRYNDQTHLGAVMCSTHDGRPGDEYTVSDTRRNTLSYTCLMDGRILVSASNPHGYYLMTPARNDGAKYERIECEVAKKGLLDRVSVSPSEKKVCFELRPNGRGPYRFVGHVLYIADFDAKARTITNPKVIANAEANPAPDVPLPSMDPRRKAPSSTTPNKHRDSSLANDDTDIWSRGQSTLHVPPEGTDQTIRISIDPNANYMYPHGEKTPK